MRIDTVEFQGGPVREYRAEYEQPLVRTLEGETSTLVESAGTGHCAFLPAPSEAALTRYSQRDFAGDAPSYDIELAKSPEQKAVHKAVAEGVLDYSKSFNPDLRPALGVPISAGG